MPQHDEKPPPRWIHVSSWVATTGLLSLLLNLGSASAAIQAASASRPSEGKMRWLLVGQTVRDPKATSENPESATPPELMLCELQQHWADQGHEILHVEGTKMHKQTYQVWYSPEHLHQYASQLNQCYRKRARAEALP